MNSLDINTTSVTFEKNMAYATVAFHPKGDPSLSGGMTMKYTLEARDGKWTVVNVGDSQGHHGVPGEGAGSTLPPGHPAVGNSMNPDSMNPDATNPQATGRTQ